MEGINKYGVVTDVELAKRIIVAWVKTFDEVDYKFIETVEKDLFEFDHGFFVERNEETETIYFGGPWGDSGIVIYTLESFYEEILSCPSCDGPEYDINSQRLVVIDIDKKPTVFVLREYD